MIIFYNFALIIFFSAIFALSIFIIERIKISSWFIQIKIINSTKLFIEGAIYSLLLLGINVFFENISSTLISFWLIGFFILATSKETTIALISVVPATVYYLFMKNIDAAVYASYGTIFALAISIKLALFFSNNWFSRITTYPIFVFVSLVTWLVIAFSANNINLSNSMNQIFFTTIGAIVSELIIFWFLKTSVSANVLYESINYAFSKYYRSQIKNEAIGKLISKEKINKALYIVFDINVESDIIDSVQEISETILTDLEKEFPMNTIFFQCEDSKYGAFLPIYADLDLQKLINDNYDFKPKDNLDFIRTILSKLSTSYKLKNKSIVPANLSAGISIYGIQGYSLNKLEKNASFMLDYVKRYSNNPIAVFDPMEFHARKRDAQDLLILNDAIDLSSLKMSFLPIYGTENINYVEFISINEEEYIKSLSEYIYGHGLIETYNRYLSASAINASKGKNIKIAIPYSFEYIGNLEINRFIKRLDLMGYSIKNIVFIFHGIEIKQDKNIREKIEELRSSGLEIAFISIKHSQKSLVDFFEPNYIFHKKLEKENIFDNSVILNVENDSQFENILKSGISKFAGNLISAKTKPHILSKQSKIYIEDKKREVKHE